MGRRPGPWHAGCSVLLVAVLAGCAPLLYSAQRPATTSAAPVRTQPVPAEATASPVQQSRVEGSPLTPVPAGGVFSDPVAQGASAGSWLVHSVTRAELLGWLALLLLWRALGRRWQARRLLGQMQQQLARRTQAALAWHQHFHGLLAHELRSPLAALGAQAAQLEALKLPPRARVHVRHIRRGVQHMSHLLTQLMSLSRGQLVQHETAATPAVSVQEVLRDIVAQLLPQLQRKQQELAWVHGQDARLQISTIDLHTLLRNLLENASRYTPAGGRVEVSLLREPPQAWIQIADTGPGIPQDQLDRVFDPFYRLAPQAGGSGLGLSIVQLLAARWGGQVSLCNRAGGGLVASVRLPLAQAAASA